MMKSKKNVNMTLLVDDEPIFKGKGSIEDIENSFNFLKKKLK